MSKYFWGIVIVSSSVGLGAGRVVVDLISEVGKEAKDLLSKSSHSDEKNSEITPVVELPRVVEEQKKEKSKKSQKKEQKHVVVSISRKCTIWHTDYPNRWRDPQIKQMKKLGDHVTFLSTVKDRWDVQFKIELRSYCDQQLKQNEGKEVNIYVYRYWGYWKLSSWLQKTDWISYDAVKKID